MTLLYRTVLLSFMIFFTIWIATANAAMPSVKYVLKIQTENANCLVYINGMQAISTLSTLTGTISTGLDTTAYVENGSNDFMVWFGPAGDQSGTYDFVKPSKCNVTIEAKTPEKSLIISNITIEATEELLPTAQKSLYYNGGDLTSKIEEDKVPDFNAYQAHRTFTLKEVPQWAWTTATPFTPTPENMQKLRDAYMEIWLAMDKKNIKKMKTLTSLTVDEQARHEGISSELFFSTYDFESDFQKSQGAKSIDFTNYSLKTFRGGRLIQLQDENEKSPLASKMSKSSIKNLVYYKPFLSLIDGKIVISR